MTRLLLIRHGATQANEQLPHILQGSRIDLDLSDAGRRQCHALATLLAAHDIRHIYAGGLRRARQTAEIVAASRDLQVATLKEFAEIDFGEWHGRTWQRIADDFPEDYACFRRSPSAFVFPGGESYGDVLARAGRLLRELLTRHVGETALVVSHSMVNRILCADLLGLDLDRVRRVPQRNGCLNIIHGGADWAQLVTMNACVHLE